MTVMAVLVCPPSLDALLAPDVTQDVENDA